MATEQKTSRRVVGVLSAIYFAPGEAAIRGDQDLAPGVQPAVFVRTAVRGEEVDLHPTEEKRLDAIGALLPKGSSPEDALEETRARADAYRGLRGDNEALARHQQRLAAASGSSSGVTAVDADVDGSSVHDLSEWLKDNKPTVDDTVALAGDDPARAEKVLEAERLASGNKPRAGVESQLTKIAER